MSDLLHSVEAAPIRAEELSKEGETLYMAVSTYPPIDSPAIADVYASELMDVRARREFIEAERVKITGPLNAALRAANKHFKRADSPYESVELVLKGHLGLWQIAQRKAAEQAQRQAEALAQAERERLRAEAAAKEQEARAAAQDAPELALELVQDAAELREEAISTVAPLVAAPAKIAGIQLRGTWKGEIVSKRSLIEFIATHPEYDNVLEVKQSAIDGLARSLKDKMHLPGVEARFVPIVAAGRK